LLDFHKEYPMAGVTKSNAEIDKFMNGLIKRNPGEPEFHQTVQEVANTIIPFTLEHPEYRKAQIFERMTEPDRVIIFRVTWEDDEGNFRVNRAWRVQFNNSIGPYKGGMRFHPSVTLSVLKFLGFEQVLKNSLTTLPMGGGKGSSKFNPQGQERRRGYALLPFVDDRTLPPHWRGHRHPGGRYRRRRP